METNVKKCKQCQTEIDSKAKKCPHCQSDLRSWPSRHPILTFLALLIFVPMFIGVISSDKKEISNSNSNPANDIVVEQPSLELLNFSCSAQSDFFIIEGQVKNISDKSIKNVAAVGNTYTNNNDFVTSDNALIDYNPILSGQISPFKIIITGNPAIKKCTVDFKELFGGSILTKKNK